MEWIGERGEKNGGERITETRSLIELTRARVPVPVLRGHSSGNETLPRGPPDPPPSHPTLAPSFAPPSPPPPLPPTLTTLRLGLDFFPALDASVWEVCVSAVVFSCLSSRFEDDVLNDGLKNVEQNRSEHDDGGAFEAPVAFERGVDR